MLVKRSKSITIDILGHSNALKMLLGILTAGWRIFHKPIRATVENVENYTLACLAFHNYLRLTGNAHYTPSDFLDSEYKDGNYLPGE